MARASKLTKAQWAEARALYEAGKSARAIARQYGLSHSVIVAKVTAEGWKQDAEAAIRARTIEKVSGVPVHADPEKKEEAIEAEADRRVAVLERHREEWEQVAELQARAIRFNREAVATAEKLEGEDAQAKYTIVKDAAVDKARAAEAFDLAKFAKINAETTAIRHAGERKAIGMDTPEDDPRSVRVIVERKGKEAA